MIIKRWQTPAGEASWSIHPFCIRYDYPNEAEIVIVWGLTRMTRFKKGVYTHHWVWLWNEGV